MRIFSDFLMRHLKNAPFLTTDKCALKFKLPVTEMHIPLRQTRIPPPRLAQNRERPFFYAFGATGRAELSVRLLFVLPSDFIG
jgi:hypothetical protein